MSEARDAHGEFLEVRGSDRCSRTAPLDAALDRLLDAVRGHAAQGELSDDVAVMLLEHTTAGAEYQPLVGEHDWRTSLPL